MLTTKRYEYLSTERISVHPVIGNHRTLYMPKVAHLEQDIMRNGLLEPLVVWERNSGEYFLVGGFHRFEAIKEIRKKNPGYFDRVDVRVVAGDPDEIRALNLKLNADRLDTKVTDYFETVLYLNNVNWAKDRIAEFLDKSVSWIEDILRFAPMVTEEMKQKLESNELSWNRAKEIIQRSMSAPVGQEKEVLITELARGQAKIIRPFTFKTVISKLTNVMKTNPRREVTLSIEDLYSLILTLQGKKFEQEHLERVKTVLPELVEQ